jgi:hypothetical protein
MNTVQSLKQAISRKAPKGPFSDLVLSLIRSSVAAGDVILTVSDKKPNQILAITTEGIWVETDKSRAEGKEQGELVEAWMIERAWRYLVRDGEISKLELEKKLAVHRSSFVCALLAVMPDIQVLSTSPIVLRMAPPEHVAVTG